MRQRMMVGAAAIVAAVVVTGSPAGAQTTRPNPAAGQATPTAPAPAGGHQPAEAQRAFQPKNVQVLVGLGREQFQQEMAVIAKSLGFNCDSCHVDGNFASDEKREKQTARRMLQMTKAINEQFFARARPTEGTTMGRVTCHTCHRGAEHPVHLPLAKPTVDGRR